MPELPKIDIRPDYWDIVRDILQKHVPQYAVWAFGSRAKWTAKEYSDLDLSIITDKPLSLDVSASLSDDLSESDLPWKVDIVDWASTSESFRKVIERDKVVVQEASKTMQPAARMDTWASKELIDCTTDGLISYGIVQPGRHDEEGVPIIRVNNFKNGSLDTSDVLHVAVSIEESYKRTRLGGGEVLLTLVGSTGQTAIVTDDLVGWNVARAIAVIRPSPEIGAKWINICLQSDETKRFLDDRANTTVQKTLNLADVKRIPIPIPPTAVRHAIETVITSITDKIDLNRRINQTLEAMAQAIFKSWFVDFDPVKAKIAANEQGEDPLRAAMRAISGKTDTELDQMPREHHDQLATTAALFPDAMQESELGEIPKGWEVSTIGEMVEIAGGATPDTKNESYWNPPEYFWTSPKDLSGAQSPVLLTTERKISTAGLSRIGSGLLPKGTLLMSSRAPIGYLAITQIPVAINQGYIAMLPGGNLPPLYLLMWCQQNMEEIKGQANGSTFMEISKKAFRPMLVINPGSVVLDRFIETVAPLFGKLAEGVKESSQLAELRDTLLPKLLSGELRVPDAECSMEEV